MSYDLTLDQVKEIQPEGAYIASRGCYYFLDYDNDLGYFQGLANGKFECTVKYVDQDLCSDEENSIFDEFNWVGSRHHY